MKKRTFLTGLATGLALQPARAFEVEKEPRPLLKGKAYSGPKVTQLLLYKDRRELYLLNQKDVLKSFPVRLGFNPEGHKLKQGDGRTPEGLYFVDRRNYNSRYYLSLGISYPNSRDIARARSQGVDAGGDIFIHGGPRTAEERKKERSKNDWTAGCIALRDHDMMEVFWMTDLGVPIYIRG
jgi:murein L,D-transpeptidase YafK